MPDQRVVLMDTSVLDKLIGLDGEEEARDVLREFESRKAGGQLFAIPVTSIIESGNHVAQRGSRKHAAALVEVIERAKSMDPPWVIRAVTWDLDFLGQLIAGDSTGSNLVSLLGDSRMGTGDVAILVERDDFRDKSAYTTFEVWSLDAELRAYGAP